jgi:F-type H+-transporting ATPase subunit a
MAQTKARAHLMRRQKGPGVADTNPIDQFKISTVADFSVGGLNLSFTNSSYFMLVSALLVTGLLALAMSKRALVPNRAQSVAELMYEFVAGMIRSTAGDAGLKFFPLVFSLFAFILMGNMLGMLPYFPAPGLKGFTFTSHIIVTFALAMTGHSGGGRLWRVQARAEILLLPLRPGRRAAGRSAFVTPIELISFLSRPITLGVRCSPTCWPVTSF